MHRAAPQTRTGIPVSHGSGFDLRVVLWRPDVIATFQILSQVLDPDPPLKTSTLSTAIFLLRISHSLPAPSGLPKPVPKLLPPHLLLPTIPLLVYQLPLVISLFISMTSFAEHLKEVGRVIWLKRLNNLSLHPALPLPCLAPWTRYSTSLSFHFLINKSGQNHSMQGWEQQSNACESVLSLVHKGD